MATARSTLTHSSEAQRAHALASETRVRYIAGAAVALGVAMWFVAPFFMDLTYDANAYVATGHGFARTGELVLEWGDVLTWGLTGPGHSHHFPPAYPLYLGFFFKAFGYGLAQAKVAAVLMSLATLAVVYATTRDLYGQTPALVTAGVVALSPHVLWVTGMGFSENLAMLLFTLTMWGIVRSLKDERYIVLAGIFAGLAYLARSSMGLFFVIAGGAGLCWRLYHRGWRRTLSSPWYGAAIVLFGLIVGAWAWRNVVLFEWPNWETSPGVRGIPEWIWDHKPAFVAGLIVRTPLLLAVAAPLVAFAWPEARRSWRRIRDEQTSALWLSVVLVMLLGIIFSAAYFSMGPSRYELLRLDNMRYGMVAIVPLAWALAREADWTQRTTRVRWGAMAVVFLLGAAAVFSFPAQYLPAQMARSLDPHLEPGDLIQISGTGKYPFYAYLTRPEAVDVYVSNNGPPGVQPEWIISTHPQDPAGYVRVLEGKMEHPWWAAADDYAAVYGRADVVEARGITELAPPRTGW